MINVRIFAALILLSFVGLAGLRYIPVSEDVFSGEHSEKLDRLSYLPMEIVAREKFSLRSRSAVEVGIFGNSHTWEVRAAHLDLPSAGFFNFSVPDSSIRQTVRTLEMFQEHDRLPNLVIIGIDNFEQTLVRNPVWPAPPLRWVAALRDLFGGFRQVGIPLADVVWLGLRHGKFELEEFKNLFDAQRVYGNLQFRLPKWLPPLKSPHGSYRTDGSYAIKTESNRQPKRLVSTNAMLPGYFLRDIEQLAAVTAQVPRVILVEVPIEHASARYYAENPSSSAQATRAIFRSSCRKLELECYEAPIVQDAESSGWRDAHHPPPSVLGALIRDALNQKIDQVK